MPLPVLELPAEPRQRGEAHGEALREAARALYQAHLEQLVSQPAVQARGITDDQSYQAYAARYLPAVEAFAPELWVECQGIAAGAAMTPLQILAQNLYLESHDLQQPGAPVIEGGCTAFAQRRARGDAVVGQTYDMPEIYEPAAFVLRTQVGEVEIVALSFAGALAACGLSSGGFAVVINKLFGSDSRIGVPYCVLVRRMLEQPSPGWALSALLGARRAGSMNYIIGDGAGLMFNIETTATGWEMLQDGDPFMVHTNHFIGPRGKGFEARDFAHYGAHTLVRYARARQLLEGFAGDEPLEGYRRIHCDRHNEPWGIRVQSPPGGFMAMKTVATALFEPASGRALLGQGNADVNAMTPFTLEQREAAE